MGVGELTVKLQTLSPEDYNMVAMLVDLLADRPLNVLTAARKKLPSGSKRKGRISL